MSVRQISTLGELQALLAQPKLTVVDFFATWCGPCLAIAPKIDQLALSKPHVNFCKVDVDRATEITRAYPVSCMPTFMFFKNGSIADRFEGGDISAITSRVSNLEVIPPPKIPSDADLEEMKPRDLLSLMRLHHIDSTGLLEKSELIAQIKKFR